MGLATTSTRDLDFIASFTFSLYFFLVHGGVVVLFGNNAFYCIRYLTIVFVEV